MKLLNSRAVKARLRVAEASCLWIIEELDFQKNLFSNYSTTFSKMVSLKNLTGGAPWDKSF